MFPILAEATSAVLTDALPTLLLLVGLELVLGVDNVLVIAILSNRLPLEQRNKARLIGLTLAMVVRVAMLFGVTWLLGLNVPLRDQYPVLASQGWLSWITWLAWKDLILISGGLFLIYKAVKEIHHTVEAHDEHHETGGKAAYWPIVGQIVLLDIVFSVDSVITAVGMTKHLWVIITAVVLSFSIILAFARPIGEFILRNPALKILALAFLVTIGVTIFMEGMHKHVEKAYIYLPMGFALGVELLQMRHASNQRRRGESAHG
ncbi:MAG: TerC family protein [Verrucomicrobiales bacterium]